MYFLNRSLVVKITLIVLIAVVCSLSTLLWLTTERQLESMERIHGEGARALAQSLATGVRNTMLRGEGLAVSEFIREAQENIDLAEIHVYAPTGEEVFGKPESPPPLVDVSPPVRQVLSSGQSVTEGGLRAHAIPNEARCRSCHVAGDLRGVLSLSTADAEVPTDATEPSLQALSGIARSGFVQIMTGRKEEDLEDYFAALVKATPGLEAIAVLDNTGEPYFTAGEAPLSPAMTAKAITPVDPFSAASDGHITQVLPLKNEPRCAGCHEDDEAMRGALLVRFDPTEMRGPDTLHPAILTSLQHVMLAGLGRLVVGFIDEVGESGLVSSLAVHDAAGRTYHDAFHVPEPPDLIRQALETGEVTIAVEEDRSAYQFVAPLHNEPRCQSCHGTEERLRGAISVTLNTSADKDDFEKLQGDSFVHSGLTIFMLLILLYIALRWTVLRPVKLIGEAADAVGAGQLDVNVELNRADEMGRLAEQINEMTRGLRQRLELAKFVSDETFRAVERAEAVERVGARRRVTVLFSDIRGFTAYSETREPEEVVEMLNAYLQAQAEVVVRHHGDIDKFVGDELMARFDGEAQAARAVQAAVEMVAAVAELNRTRGAAEGAMAVGIGVNTGEVVVGAMGAEQRMDYTVIGDAVNLGARLCSAAGRNEVVISAATRDACGTLAGVSFEEMAPIKVKGKTDAISVVRATSAAEGGD